MMPCEIKSVSFSFVMYQNSSTYKLTPSVATATMMSTASELASDMQTQATPIAMISRSGQKSTNAC